MKKFATFLVTMIPFSSAFSAPTPAALKALMRSPDAHVYLVDEEGTRDTNKSVITLLSEELVGENRLYSDCDPRGEGYHCIVTLSRIPAAAGSMTFGFEAIYYKPAGEMIVTSKINLAGN